jgi:hypothetical protein
VKILCAAWKHAFQAINKNFYYAPHLLSMGFSGALVLLSQARYVAAEVFFRKAVY